MAADRLFQPPQRAGRRVDSGHRQVPQRVGGVARVLGRVVVGHPRRRLDRGRRGERGVGLTDRPEGLGAQARLRVGAGTGGVQHGFLRGGEPLGAHEAEFGVGDPLIGVCAPDRLAGTVGVDLGAQVPVPGFLGALGGESEEAAGVVVGVGVEGHETGHHEQLGDRGEGLAAQTVRTRGVQQVGGRPQLPRHSGARHLPAVGVVPSGKDRGRLPDLGDVDSAHLVRAQRVLERRGQRQQR
ncbi:hypothetical protein NI17_009780 [Thermobifida halotolerans]|uniref:Uncharacterized protein n=1 Tax=Thermobifida halotolerans TaxID=483545 RepID=A0A399FXE4_9ACTN|nr:hypothetical protein [Thermobifida halotolerans]UOE21374.1 hypothetical protein NI17_009780 [Thermobifida halotolerans]